jgi:hypothetical protein
LRGDVVARRFQNLEAGLCHIDQTARPGKQIPTLATRDRSRLARRDRDPVVARTAVDRQRSGSVGNRIGPVTARNRVIAVAAVRNWAAAPRRELPASTHLTKRKRRSFDNGSGMAVTSAYLESLQN